MTYPKTHSTGQGPEELGSIQRHQFVDVSGYRGHAWRGVTAGAPITGPIVGTLGISMETFNSSYILLSIECIYSNA